MKHLLKNLMIGGIAVLALSPSVYAGKFDFTVNVYSYFGFALPPNSADACQEKAYELEKKLVGLLEKADAGIVAWKATVVVNAWTEELVGARECNLNIKGETKKEVSVVYLSSGVDRLRRRGYKRKDFLKACDDTARAFSLNPFELAQDRDINQSAFRGKECIVTSTVLTVE